MRLYLLPVVLALACSSEGRFRLSWEIRVGTVAGPRAACDPEAKVEIESKNGDEVLRDVFPCSDMMGTTKPLPGGQDLQVTIRYVTAAEKVIAATPPTKERAKVDGVTDLGTVVIVRPDPPEDLVMNLRWSRHDPGDDSCVPKTTGAAVVKRLAYSLYDMSGAPVAASPALGTTCPDAGGAMCTNVLMAPNLAHGDYLLDIQGTDDTCRPCWPMQRIPVTHTGGILEILITQDPACATP